MTFRKQKLSRTPSTTAFADRGFAEYLGTLGLRSHDGRDKQAFEALRRESSARGW